MRAFLSIPLIFLLLGLLACDNSSTRDDDAPRESQTAEETADDTATAATDAQPGSDLENILRDPSLATAEAPEEFQVRFETTKGGFTMEVYRDWAPHGADRLYNLARIGYFDDVAFFRVIDGFMVQFGIHGDPEIAAAWREADIADDPRAQSNERGLVTFATRGPNTRTTQLFINYGNNTFLDNQGFSPVGRIIDGMDVVDNLYSGYGEGAPRGRGPDQGRIQNEGNEYLRSHFENLDYTTRVFVIED